MTTPDERTGPAPEPPLFASPSGSRPIPADPPAPEQGAVPAAPSQPSPPSQPAPQVALSQQDTAPIPTGPQSPAATTTPAPGPVATSPWSLAAQQSATNDAAPTAPGYGSGPYGRDAYGSGSQNPPQSWPPGAPPADVPSGPVRVGKPRRSLSVAWVVPLLVLAMLAGLVGGVLGANLNDDDRLASADLPVRAADGTGSTPARAPDSVAGIAQEVLPSVVSIEAASGAEAATGSGFVLREDGYLLTNNHVVAGAAGADGTLTVTFSDGRERTARVVGRTPDYDLAVIKVDETGLKPLVLGDSTDVAVGDPVVAIGAPLGLAGTVTTGIVSALNRPVAAGDEADTAFINAIQTDAAINPGNSGGPLVNAEGEVIGINSAIAQPPGGIGGVAGNIGLGFAIPSNQARRTAEQLIESGRATYPIIGVSLDQTYQGEGVKVAASGQGTSPVTPDGPADRAGIRAGDVITAIDGRPVTQPDELIVAIRAHEPGDVIELVVRTGEDERTVRVTLDEAGD
jgi:putative serine protease PepD